MDEEKGLFDNPFDDLIMYLLPMLIKIAQEILDKVVNGATLTEHQVMALKSACYELETWGLHFAADTTNTWDEVAIQALIDSIKDALGEM